MTENVCQIKQGYTNASLNPEVIGTGGVPTEENGYTDYHGFLPYIYNIDPYNAEYDTHYQSPLGVLCQNQENCKRKSVDNSRTYNAFALTARWTMPPYTKGAAALYPGLCASAPTARAGQYIFCEQVVRVNQEQFHFEYIKLYTLIIKCSG